MFKKFTNVILYLLHLKNLKGVSPYMGDELVENSVDKSVDTSVDKSVDNSIVYPFHSYLADLIDHGIMDEDEWKRFINKDDE